MKVFEILIIAFAAFSVINLAFIKERWLGIIFSSISAIFCVLSLIYDGYRLEMLIDYCLSAILFAIELLHFIHGRLNMKKWMRIAYLSILTLLLVAGIVFPLLFPVVDLPKPDGTYSVGTSVMAFTDKSRNGIFSAAGTYRELAVQVWYPADAVEFKQAQNYISDSSVGANLSAYLKLPNILSQLKLIKTNSIPDIGLSNKENKYPVILFSHGYGGFSGQNTIQMEELASYGYVVFSIAHTYEASSSVFPNGKIIPFNAEQKAVFFNEYYDVRNNFNGDITSNEFTKYDIKNSIIAENSVHIWSDDTSFVADQIEKLNRGEDNSIFENKLDMSNMGVFGHSFGGATAGQVCLKDSRFKAFINMDGTPYGDTAINKITQPFMILTEGAIKEHIASGYSPEQNNYLIVAINGAKHFDFTDFTVIMPGLKNSAILGNVDGIRQEKIINDYVLSFFNRYLKGMTEPLIDQLLPTYNEVDIQSK